MIIALLGNKVDLAEVEDTRQVEKATAEAFAREKGLWFKETSAKSGQGISEIFNEMASSLELQKKKGEPDGISITQSKLNGGGGGCCSR
jgi:Ras-related protein Rab-5C